MTSSSPMPAHDAPVLEIGFSASANTGWGLIALHVALGFARDGWRVHLPRDSDLSGVSRPLIPALVPMLDVGDPSEHRVRIDAFGNGPQAFTFIPNRTRVVFAVFEDTAIPQQSIDTLGKYDLVLTPSTWAHDHLARHGIVSTIWHQGYDDSVFLPAPRRRPDGGPFLIFSGGKLEFRKGQDIVIEAFRRFRETGEGKDAMLVTAWQNRWPQTMEGIWSSGYVKGVPAIRNGLLDIPSWLEANGIPREAVIDLGFPSQMELAAAIRECDVAVFPNRCEGATNLVLPEVLGCGIPAIVSACAGQRDVWSDLPFRVRTTPVTLPCTLYDGMDGWGETDPADLVERLQTVATTNPTEFSRDQRVSYAILNYSWRLQVHALMLLLNGVAAHA